MAKPKERAHGEGSVFRVGDKWAAEITLPPGPDGRRRRRRKIRATKKAAGLALAELRADLADDGPLDRAGTVGQFLGRWLRDDVSKRPNEGTSSGYAAIVRLHLVPALGHIRLRELGAAHIEAWLAAERALPVPPAPSTQRTRLGVLRSALSTARRWKLVRDNEARHAQGPAVPKKDPPALSLPEARAIERAVAGDRFEPLYLLALYMGLRSGEALGLRWEAVDLEARTLHVARQLQRRKGRWEESPPKSAAGVRELAMPAPVADSLRRHRERQAFERRAAAAWPWGDLVFTHPDGRPVYPDTVLIRLAELLRAANLERRTYHQLRHAAASLLFATGADLKTVQAVLGHASLAITANLYTHVFRESLRAASDRLEAAMRDVSEGP